MKVITQYPVYIDKKLVGGEDFLSLDGKSSAAEIRAFQIWYNSTYKSLARIAVNGLWGDSTAKAYKTTGVIYDNRNAEKTPITKDTTGGAGAGIGAGAEAAAAQGKQGVLDKIGDALGLTEDTTKPDKKGMNKTVKYVLIGVGVLAVLGITYALVKKK
jgi:hypothetical protein